ncbi:MAG: ABC transporter permease, partial [Bacteroidales bacterium]|nr:ABC transporter permease [Bacteroidales bacterium]
MLRHYLKIAFRNLWKYKTQSLVSIFGLAFGLACLVFGGYWIHWETTYDSFFPDAQNIYILTQPYEDGQTNLIQFKTAQGVTAQIPELEQMSFVNLDLLDYFQIEEQPRLSMDFDMVDSSFLNLFRFEFVAGSAASFKHTPQSIILTQRTANKLFGNENPVGKQLKQITPQYFGNESVIKTHTIVAVIKDLPRHTNFNFELLINWSPVAENYPFNCVSFYKIHTDANIQSINNRLSGITFGEDAETGFSLTPLSGVRTAFHSWQMKYSLAFVRIFAIALLLACLGAVFNFISLNVHRTLNRNNEFNLRKTLGADKRRLVALYLWETAMPVVVAFLLSVIIVKALQVPFEWLSGVDMQDVAIAIVWSVGVCVLLVTVMYGIFRTGVFFRKRNRPSRYSAQRSLCTAQIIIASFLMMVALVSFRQMKFMVSADLGMKVDNVAMMYLGMMSSMETNPEPVKSRLAESPYISDVVIFPGNMINYPGAVSAIVSWSEHPEEATWRIYSIPDIHFFSFFDLRLLEGRLIDEHDVKKCVISETAARRMGENMIGQRLAMSGFELEITGVVKDIFGGSTHEPAPPVLFVSSLYASDEPEIFFIMPYMNHYYIKVLPENRTRATEHIRQVMQEFHADASSFT